MIKVKTKLAQLRVDRGNISYENISESTGIDSEQLRELEIGEASSIAFTTMAQLCNFFQCTLNDLFVLDSSKEEIDTTPPSAEAIASASEIIKQGLAGAEAMLRRPTEEIWAEFEAVRARVGA